MGVQYLGDRGPDGVCMGYSSSEPIAFYGATPAARTDFSASAVETTAAISTTTTKWGFSTSTQANAIVSLVNEIRAALVTLGLKA
jgi:UDP-N-acetyl-D-mannosaminuronic acid transferase (WecB/TagA/CpsF family)